MTATWIDLTLGTEKSRHPLDGARLRFGGDGCDIVLPGAAGDELHVWSDPPTAVLVGGATTPLVNGRAFEEARLEKGDSIQWLGAVLVFGSDARAMIQELHEHETPAASVGFPEPPAADVLFGPTEGERRAWHRLQAGMLVELGLAARGETKRWQDAVLRNEFDPDACARDVLQASSIPADDPRLIERAGRLERDLLMSAFQRGVAGASRRARTATRSGAAFLLANLIAISVYTLVIVAILLLARVKYSYSLDALLDSWLDMLPG